MDVERATLLVRVQPRAKRNTVQLAAGGGIKVYVTAPPEDGRANDAVVELLAERLGLKRRQVEIISGETNRNKVVRITGLSAAQVEAALRDSGG